MAAEQQQFQKAQAYVRWRPMNENELNLGHEEMSRKSSPDKNGNTFSVELKKTSDGLQENTNFNFANVPSRMRMKKRKRGEWSGNGFSGVIESESNNEETFQTCLRPLIDDFVLSKGGVANCFAYGQTGSGKTHTMLGPESEPGIIFQAGEHIFQAIDEINVQNAADENNAEEDNELFVYVRFSELYSNNVYNLLDNRTRCDLLESRDRLMKIRKTTIFEIDGLERKMVRSEDMPGVVCRTPEEIRQVILNGTELRKSGTSSVHDQSSRSHAIIEMEIVTQTMLDIRDQVATYDSQVTYVGNSVREPIPPSFNCKSRRSLEIRFAEAQKAEAKEVERLREAVAPFAGGKMLLCDLAGAEIGSDIVKIGGEFVSSGQLAKQTKEDRREAIEINKSLSALAGCLKDLNSRKTRISYRESTLTKLLRRYLEGENCATVMVANVAPSLSFKKLTVQTLRYANMLALKNNKAGNKSKKSKNAKRSRKKVAKTMMMAAPPAGDENATPELIMVQ